MIIIFKNKHSGIFLFLVLFIFLSIFTISSISSEKSKGHFPVSVWYAGGKARAPMLEKITPEKVHLWKKDLQQIKDLGFNTVRPWVEWTNNEPEEGRYDFSALETLVDLADKIGLKVIIQVYIDSAPDWLDLNILMRNLWPAVGWL